MKILVVPTWYPSGEDKLMGIYHKEFTRALNKYGIKADMLYIDRQRISKPLKYLFMKKNIVEEEENYKVYTRRVLNLRPISFDLHMKAYTHAFNKALKKYIKENGKPDIIHAMVSVPAGYAATKNKYGIPVLVTEHGGDLERLYRDETYKKYGLYTLKHARFSVVSGYMKDIVLKYTDYCGIIPNQVDTSLFKNDVTHKLKDTFKILTVCALREGKRLDIAFDAIKKCIDEGLNIEYTIIGDGFYENIFKEECKKKGMIKYTTFAGRKTKPEISEYLKNADALLVSSELESFCIPIIEALSSGIPVITTDCKGPKDFIDTKCGAIAKVNDPTDLARAIKEVYKNYKKYDKKHLESVADRYSEKRIVKIAKKEYDSILKKH